MNGINYHWLHWKLMFSHLEHQFTPPPVISCNNTPLLDFRSALPIKSILIALVVLLLPAIPAFAAEIEVNDTCGISDAIKSANTNASVGGCTAGDAGEDTITLTKDDTMAATGAAGISITQSLVINGQGHTLTNVRYENHFNIASNITVTVNDVVFTGHGSHQFVADGGVIQVTRGTLNINDSVFHGNQASSRGGALHLGTNSSATINRSVFYNNRASNGGAILIESVTRVAIYNSLFYNNSDSAIRLSVASEKNDEAIIDHVTIVNNSNGNQGHAAGISNFGQIVTRFTLRNSIVYGNTGGHGDCLLQHTSNQSNVVTNNIIGEGDSTTCNLATQLRGNPGLRDASSVTILIHLFPPPGSNAIDAADCITGVSALELDFVKVRRPQGSRCDIGAYESAPPPPRADDGDDEDPSSSDAAQVSARPAISTCLTLPGIQVTGLSESTQCQRVDAVAIANPNIQQGDFVDAVDVWSWVLPNTQICFEAAGGVIKFIDTASMPRTIHDLEAYSLNGLPCAAIDGTGIVILMPGDPPPARNAASGSAPTATTGQILSGCMVRATASLNLRASPGGAVIGGVGETWLLTAVERTAGWFRVDRLGQYGWISAEYVETEGNCG